MELAREKITEDRIHVPMRDAVAGQLGRLQQGHSARHSAGPSDERNYYRQDDKNRRKRQKKSNGRRQREYREQVTAFETLQAQIRVASGQTPASPALVENARKALERRVADVLAENPDMTEEQAVEAVYSAAAGQ